jgi:hypothetical protein
MGLYLLRIIFIVSNYHWRKLVLNKEGELTLTVTTKPYSTSDTAEAAYLMAHGVRVLRTEKNPLDKISTIFLQETRGGQIGDLLLDWSNKQCPEYAFFLKYKFLLKKVMNGDSGS